MNTRVTTILGMALLAMTSIAPSWAQSVQQAQAIRGKLIDQGVATAEQSEPAKRDVFPDAPSVASNYTFATGTTGSLVDMSSGTTQLVAANQDDTASAVANIGFDFFFQGVRQSQFSANSNGVIRLGATAVQGSTPYHPLGQSGIPLISAYGADQRTHTSGKVHYKVIGSAPNRQLVVEFLNMQADFNTGGAVNLTYQVQLSETSGAIQFVYGSMAMSVAGAADGNSRDPHIGFSSSNIAGTVGSVTAPQSGTPSPTFDGASATPFANLYTAGSIPALSSAADGSRRTFSFTPPAAVTAPTSLTFTGVTPAAMTLNWVDSPNELAYAIYRSTDGVAYTFAGSAAQDATTFSDTGLVPGTLYFWRVFATSEGALSTALTGSQSTNPPGAISSTGAGGNWSDPNTWVGNVVPGTFDNVTIVSGATVTIDTAAIAYSVTVGNGATPSVLQWDSAAARTLTVGTFVTIASSGTFASPATGTIVGHVLSLGGNLTNDGVLDFSTNANTAGAGVSFTGTNSATFGGTGSTTDVRAITLAKGAIANSVELNPANFTVLGVNTDVAGFLTLTSGTFKLSGTFAMTQRVFAAAAYTIPTTGGFWLNNPNFIVAAQNGNAVANGLLRISQGTFNQGTTNAATLTTTNVAGALVIEGGTTNVAGRYTSAVASSYNQSGGVFNIATVGNSGSAAANGSFTMSSATAVLNLTGGTIVLNQASTGATPVDFNVAAVTTVSGSGKLQVGSAATATNFNFRINGNIPSMNIDATTNPKIASLRAQGNMLGTTVINPTTTFTINGFVCLVIGPTFTNNGTLLGTVAATRFYFLGGSGPTVYNGSGSVTAPLVSWEVDNIAGVTIDPAVNPIIVARINNFSGGLTGSGKLTVGNGGATTAVVQMGVAGPTAATFGFDVPLTFNPGTGGVINIYAQELGPRTTGNELPPSRTLTTLSISNTNGTTIAGGDITVNGAGAGAIALTNAAVITGSNTLYFNSTAGTVTRSGNGYVVGNFKKAYAAAASKTFEVGTANGYSPVVINATAGTFPSDITAKAVQTIAPGISPPDKAITRYWNVTAPGVTADLTFSYLDPLDIPGTVTEANLKLYRQDGLAFTDLGATVNTGANTALATGVSTFGIFTLAETGAVFLQEADLAVTLTDGVTTVDTGSALTYTLTASNSGPTAVIGASVNDTFPTDLTCSWTCVGAAGGSCTASGSGNIAALVDLPVGGSVTYTANCAVATASANTTVVNTATITPPVGITDPNSGNNSATDTDALVRLSDLSITKTDGVSTVVAGGTTTYTIVVGNAGGNDAAVTTGDTFPAALTCTWTCSATDGTCAASGTGNIADAGTLEVGGSLTYTAICGVSASATGSLSNTATVALDGASTSDPNTANNSATDTDTILGVYDVGVSISDNRDFVKIGDSLNYIIIVGNPVGPSTASTIVNDTLPAQLGAGSWICISFGGASCSSGSGNVLNDTAILPAGSQVAYVYSVTVQTLSANDLISNTVTATTVGDSNTANDSATDVDTLIIFADGFDNEAPTQSIEGLGNATDFVDATFRVDPALTAQLGIVPTTVAWGYSASGKQLLSIELARFSGNTAMRSTLFDAAGMPTRSNWTNADLAQQPLQLFWQSASAQASDGYLQLSDGGASIQIPGLQNSDHLQSLRVLVKDGSPWMSLLSH